MPACTNFPAYFIRKSHKLLAPWPHGFACTTFTEANKMYRAVQQKLHSKVNEGIAIYELHKVNDIILVTNTSTLLCVCFIPTYHSAY